MTTNLVWTKEMLDTLKSEYPHFGAVIISSILNIKVSQIRSKINKLNLSGNEIVLLPKNQRLCYTCRTNYQSKREHGVHCRECHLKKRTELRKKKTFEQHVQEHTQHLKRRTKKHFDLTPEFLINLWDKQNGECFYSGVKMNKYSYGSGHAVDNPYTPSVDKIIPELGYVQHNVVWCCIACNSGKGKMSTQQYIDLCRLVVENHDRNNNVNNSC